MLRRWPIRCPRNTCHNCAGLSGRSLQRMIVFVGAGDRLSYGRRRPYVAQGARHNPEENLKVLRFLFARLTRYSAMSAMSPRPPNSGIRTTPARTIPDADPFDCFHPVTAAWFRAVFDAPTAPQRLGWPVIARGESALILAPTGTGKTLTAFLWCLDRLMLENREQGTGIRDQNYREHGNKGTRERESRGCRVVYVSPLKALAVDVERNL